MCPWKGLFWCPNVSSTVIVQGPRMHLSSRLPNYQLDSWAASTYVFKKNMQPKLNVPIDKVNKDMQRRCTYVLLLLRYGRPCFDRLSEIHNIDFLIDELCFLLKFNCLCSYIDIISSSITTIPYDVKRQIWKCLHWTLKTTFTKNIMGFLLLFGNDGAARNIISVTQVYCQIFLTTFISFHISLKIQKDLYNKYQFQHDSTSSWLFWLQLCVLC